MGAEHVSRNDPTMITVHLKDCLNEEQKKYILSCATIRRCSVSRLIRALVKEIAEDKMVLAILDDDSRPLAHGNAGQARGPYKSRKGSSPTTLAPDSPPSGPDDNASCAHPARSSATYGAKDYPL